MRRLAMSMLALAGAMFVAAPAKAATVVVGSSPDALYPEICVALAFVSDGDTVIVESGTYLPFDMGDKRVTVRGQSQNEPPVIDANKANAFAPVFPAHCASTSGITIRGGQGPETTIATLTVINGDAPRGGGILIEDSAPVIDQLTVQDNRAVDGGGIYVVGTDDAANGALFSNVAVIGNTSTNDNILGGGGGIYANAPITIVDAIIADNHAAVRGGGLYVNSLNRDGTVKVTLSRTEICDNDASDGGGMAAAGGPELKEMLVVPDDLTAADAVVEIRESNIHHNEASAEGGGVHNLGGKLDIATSLITFNRALGGEGGGIYATRSRASRIMHSLVADNEAFRGGGFYLWRDTPLSPPDELVNLLVVDNEATGDGGAFYIEDAFPMIRNSTIARNTASPTGGIHAIRTGAEATPRVEIINSIVYDNINALAPGPIPIPTLTVQISEVPPLPTAPPVLFVSHSDIEGLSSVITVPTWATTCVSCIDNNPLFAFGPTSPLEPNGGYYLDESSPCIDSGAEMVAAPLVGSTTRVDQSPDTGNVDMGFHYGADALPAQTTILTTDALIPGGTLAPFPGSSTLFDFTTAEPGTPGYLLVGSLTPGPGAVVNQQLIPITPDALTTLTLASAAPFKNTVGSVFGGKPLALAGPIGFAEDPLVCDSDVSDCPFAGLTMKFVVVLVNSNGKVLDVSNAVSLRL